MNMDHLLLGGKQVPCYSEIFSPVHETPALSEISMPTQQFLFKLKKTYIYKEGKKLNTSMPTHTDLGRLKESGSWQTAHSPLREGATCTFHIKFLASWLTGGEHSWSRLRGCGQGETQALASEKHHLFMLHRPAAHPIPNTVLWHSSRCCLPPPHQSFILGDQWECKIPH